MPVHLLTICSRLLLAFQGPSPKIGLSARVVGGFRYSSFKAYDPLRHDQGHGEVECASKAATQVRRGSRLRISPTSHLVTNSVPIALDPDLRPLTTHVGMHAAWIGTHGREAWTDGMDSKHTTQGGVSHQPPQLLQYVAVPSARIAPFSHLTVEATRAGMGR